MDYEAENQDMEMLNIEDMRFSGRCDKTYTSLELIRLKELINKQTPLEEICEIMDRYPMGIRSILYKETTKNPEKWNPDLAKKYITEAEALHQKGRKARYMVGDEVNYWMDLMKGGSSTEEEKQEIKLKIFTNFESYIEKEVRKEICFYFAEKSSEDEIPDFYKATGFEFEDDLIQEVKARFWEIMEIFKIKEANMLGFISLIAMNYSKRSTGDICYSMRIPAHAIEKYLGHAKNKDKKEESAADGAEKYSNLFSLMDRISATLGDKEFDLSKIVDEQSKFTDDIDNNIFSQQFEKTIAEIISNSLMADYNYERFRAKWFDEEDVVSRESIAEKFSVTEERIRQVEENVFQYIKNNAHKTRGFRKTKDKKEESSEGAIVLKRIPDEEYMVPEILESMEEKQRLFTLS